MPTTLLPQIYSLLPFPATASYVTDSTPMRWEYLEWLMTADWEWVVQKIMPRTRAMRTVSLSHIYHIMRREKVMIYALQLGDVWRALSTLLRSEMNALPKTMPYKVYNAHENTVIWRTYRLWIFYYTRLPRQAPAQRRRRYRHGYTVYKIILKERHDIDIRGETFDLPFRLWCGAFAEEEKALRTSLAVTCAILKNALFWACTLPWHARYWALLNFRILIYLHLYNIASYERASLHMFPVRHGSSRKYSKMLYTYRVYGRYDTSAGPADVALFPSQHLPIGIGAIKSFFWRKAKGYRVSGDESFIYHYLCWWRIKILPDDYEASPFRWGCFTPQLPYPAAKALAIRWARDTYCPAITARWHYGGAYHYRRALLPPASALSRLFYFYQKCHTSWI